MNGNQRPHSRKKTVGTGSAGVHTGGQVNTGSRPAGSGGRNTSSGGSRASSGSFAGSLLGALLGVGSSSGSSSGGSSGSRKSKGLNFKKILIIIIVIVILIVLFKKCSGGNNLLTNFLGGYEDLDDYSQEESYVYEEEEDEDEQVNTSVSSRARDRYYEPVGNGRDTVTIMVYMCGTDLESKYGMATKDLQEMVNADISDKVNLIVETGGCSKWQNKNVSSSKNQIFKIDSQGFNPVVSDFGKLAMTDPTNLTNFIEYCNDKYPADRNILIFWDHGGGSISGYGYDEKNTGAGSMTLPKINTALKNAGCKFDFIGFDACLMATLENALVCNEYADYLIGSEETEPGTGWYYTSWLNQISKNTSTPTVDIAKTIIDTFVSASEAAAPSAKVTLSVIDLAELQGTVPDAFNDFATSTTELIKSDDYKKVSDARAGVRQFSQQSKINQVDLVDLAQRIGTKESKTLAKALQGCVKYSKSNISRCNGVSIYFPYETTKSVNSAVQSYKDLGLDSDYTKCIQSFASLEYGGQIAASASQQSSSSLGGDLLGSLLSSYGQSSSSTSPVDVLLGSFTGGGSSSSAGGGLDVSTIASLLGGFSGRSMPEGYEWVDTELIADNAENIAQSFVDPSRITATEKDGRKVLDLTDEEWSLIQTVELNVFFDTGKGYVDLGLDNTFDWYDDNAMLLDYDGTWLTLNRNVCAYYLVSDTQQADGSWVTVGRIPALLNDELVNLQVVFDDDNPEGVITGAYPMYEDGTVDVEAKGCVQIVSGDRIQLLCDYYDYDGNYDSTYTLGKSFKVDDSGLKLINLSIDTSSVSVTYRLTDIYGNHFWVSAD